MLLAKSIVMGLGIALMHYTGMAAMQLTAIAQYDPKPIALSIAIAIFASLIVFWLAFLRRQTMLAKSVQKIASAMAIAIVIDGMHHTAMAAVSFKTNERSFIPSDDSIINNPLSPVEIGFAILIFLMLALTAMLAVLVSLFNQHSNAITARAEALRSSEERFRSLVQNASDIISVIEADGIVCYTSLSIKQILGYDPEDWLNKKACSFVHFDDVAEAESLWIEALNSSATNIKAEFRLQHADGSWRDFEVIANNLPINGKNAPAIMARLCETFSGGMNCRPDL